jgi:hypothetical protein
VKSAQTPIRSVQQRADTREAEEGVEETGCLEVAEVEGEEEALGVVEMEKELCRPRVL